MPPANYAVAILVVCLLPLRTISSTMAFLLIIWGIIEFVKRESLNDFLKNVDLRVVAILSFPTLSILVSQMLGRGWNWSEYDGPIRLLLCIPLYYVLKKANYNLTNSLQAPLSASILFVLLIIAVVPQTRDGYTVQLLSTSTRLTLSHIDAIVFGNLVATLTMLLVVFFLRKQSFIKLVTVGVIIFIGIAMVILSQTRSSLLIILTSFSVLYFFTGKLKLYHSPLHLLALSSTLILAYFFIPIIQTRIDQTFHEIYLWFSGINTQTSSGSRISMWLLSWQLFILNPIAGYGDKRFPQSFLDNQDLLQNYGQMAVETIYCCGPHNEFFANLLRAGIWGGVAYITTYALPTFIFCRHLICVNKESVPAKLGLVLTVCFFIGSLTNEMLSLKFIFSFFGIMLTIFLAEIHHEKR